MCPTMGISASTFYKVIGHVTAVGIKKEYSIGIRYCVGDEPEKGEKFRRRDGLQRVWARPTRCGRSTEDAVLHMGEKVTEEMTRKEKVAIFNGDTKSVFDFPPHQLIIEGIMLSGIATSATTLIQSYLEN